ncbi:hypothetical protein PF005_g8353 [Phytophthora fragariae]|uniref:Uncharacterized protein n=1 Tax=Phytophthora fragariae TaxID=53985 RepID=A0A6A3YFY1_9STRA|nr:hypothetical protein PF003_g2086 [Phytophthora fragariae]KAE8947500.1 hypothetical protein PF009_g2899 [Phytophthora fragariae]KAE9016605.1 hypothetical protein PF011_g7073 [Phytophthora fragariae]KAE9119177.1 hypothetical protein PF007_g8646 [Phytophthora fragariae]KAE9119366.1 hypothetical protein PF010_g7888 [Phytophthora fragariae]
MLASQMGVHLLVLGSSSISTDPLPPEPGLPRDPPSKRRITTVVVIMSKVTVVS